MRQQMNSNSSDAEAAPDRQVKYRSDAAHYVAAMLINLRGIAEKAELNQLVTALEAAYYEASIAADTNEKPSDKARAP